MSVASKLQLKADHTLAVVDQPDGVDLAFEGSSTSDPTAADAVVVFARDRVQLDANAESVVEAARRDALAWVAYPKAGQLGTDLNRDRLAEALAERGVKAVRQVAIDDTWSALRFRPAPA